MKPTGTYIQLQLITVNNTTSSGIVLSPISSTHKKGDIVEEFATVIAVGPEVTRVKPGDTVYFKEYNLDRIQKGSIVAPETIVFLEEKFVLAVEPHE